MILKTLKQKFTKTLVEPRLSGKIMPTDFLNKIINNINSADTLDEFIDVLKTDLGVTGNVERLIIQRIIVWENEPEVTFNMIELDDKSLEEKLEIIKILKRTAILDMDYLKAAELRNEERKIICEIDRQKL